MRQEHGNRLVFEESAALKLIKPDKPMTVGDVYEQLLKLTASALTDYCAQVRREVNAFVEQTLSSLAEVDRDEILRVASEQFDADLYLKRFDMFEGAIDRQYGRAGRKFDAKGLRLDILRARQNAGTSTGISRFLNSLRDDLDLRALAVTSTATIQNLPQPPEKPRDSASPKLQRDILLDLYRTSASPRYSVEARSFRVRHHQHLSVLDEMVQRGMIRDSQGFYSPVLLALSNFNASSDVQQLLDECSIVVKTLRDRYLDNQADLVATEHLAQLASMSIDRFRRALFYLNESVPLLAGSSGSVDSPLQMVLPGEKTLGLKSVEDVLAEVRRYAELASKWLSPSDHVAMSTSEPIHAVRQSRQWLMHVPSELRTLLAEVYVAQEAKLWTLVVMGVRAAIDMTCNQLVGDVGGFEQKLQKLRSSGHVSEKQREVLHAVVELGHASSHRGHVPAPEDVSDVLDILERLLKAQYVDPLTKERLLQTTPPRR